MKKIVTVASVCIFAVIVLLAQNPINPSVMTQGMTATAHFSGPVVQSYTTTFAGLPSCTSGNTGMTAWISDGPSIVGGTIAGQANSWGAPITVGGGTFTFYVGCDGFGSWRVLGL